MTVSGHGCWTFISIVSSEAKQEEHGGGWETTLRRGNTLDQGRHQCSSLCNKGTNLSKDRTPSGPLSLRATTPSFSEGRTNHAQSKEQGLTGVKQGYLLDLPRIDTTVFVDTGAVGPSIGYPKKKKARELLPDDVLAYCVRVGVRRYGYLDRSFTVGPTIPVAHLTPLRSVT